MARSQNLKNRGRLVLTVTIWGGGWQFLMCVNIYFILYLGMEINRSVTERHSTGYLLNTISNILSTLWNFGPDTILEKKCNSRHILIEMYLCYSSPLDTLRQRHKGKATLSKKKAEKDKKSTSIYRRLSVGMWVNISFKSLLITVMIFFLWTNTDCLLSSGMDLGGDNVLWLTGCTAVAGRSSARTCWCFSVS